VTAEAAVGAPALPESVRARIVAEFPKYPEKRAVLLSALHFVQEECEGWIRPEMVPEIAVLLEIREIEVWEVISFYSMFHSERVGRCHVKVCVNLSCCLRGARGMMRRLEELLDIRPGEVTEDGLFSLEGAECLGSCGTAPVIQVNNEAYLENVRLEELPAMLDRLRGRFSTSAGGAAGNGAAA